MRRHFVPITAAAIILLLGFEQWAGALDLLSRLPGAGGAVMNWLVEIDYFLLNNDIHPFLIAIGLLILLSGWIIPNVWPLVLRRLFGKARTAFFEDFGKMENQRAWQDFIWNLHIAYKTFDQNATNYTLVEKLDKLMFPNDFPPVVGSLHNYDPIWLNEESADIWRFFCMLFSDVTQTNRENPLLEREKYERFLDARRITSKFWDYWAREIEIGRLDYWEIREPIFTNFRVIQALVMSELALADEIPYDLGPGKTALFKLVLGPERLKKPGIVSKIKKWRDGARKIPKI